MNSDPYGSGWLFRVRLADGESGPPGLLSAAEYAQLTGDAPE